MSLSRPVLLAVLVSFSALVAVSAQVVSTRLVSKAVPVVHTKSVTDAAARSVIDDLDALVQKRFATLISLQGLSRVVMSEKDSMSHPFDTLYASTPDEKRLLGEVGTFHRPYEVCFFHYKPLLKTLKPKQVGRLLGYSPEARFSAKPIFISLTAEAPPSAYGGGFDINGTQARQQAALREWTTGMKAHQEELRQIVTTQIPALNRGESTSASYKNDWYMETRPLTASSASCLSCHVNVKKGDTLAAMVYLVRKDTPPTPSHPGKDWNDFATRH